MLLDIGEERMKWPQRGSQSIGFYVSNNCAYNTKIVLQHAERDGHFAETVNYLYFPIGSLPDGTVLELPASGECTLDLSVFVACRQTRVNVLFSAQAAGNVATRRVGKRPE